MSEDDNPEPETLDYRSAGLDGLRIRQLSAMRRAAYRSRSHAVIAMLVCVVAAIQCAIFLVQHLRHTGFGWRVILYAAIVVLGTYGATFFRRRAIALHREATQTYLHDPTTPPDFSQLSDGS